MLTAILSLACTEHRTDRVDPATLAAREARRQAFLAEQEAISRDALRAQRFRGKLVLERPTVVAFYPDRHLGSDTVALRQRLSQYAAVAEDQDWSFEERYSGEFRLTDSRSHALYGVAVSSDSVGLVLAAPGYPPLVWYGEIAGGELKERLRALRSWLPGRAVVTPERL
jgi:hypothetical protein